MGNNKKPTPPEKPRDDAPEKATQDPTPIETETPRDDEPKSGQEQVPLHEAIDALFAKHGIQIGVATFQLPNSKTPPIVYYTGHFYDAAKLTAQLHHQFQDEIRKTMGG